ncbi:hypothetical protein HSR121_2770 [Halapricum desulfuricans]|uniref:Uncharacterized protein n=1 Tax=Halapricum desulfuricans TaxID=2841257 RepID=A0A897MYC9_9EURY|nr:hypothetical protein HSR121_2770 [Halapricum desulfuricans]
MDVRLHTPDRRRETNGCLEDAHTRFTVAAGKKIPSHAVGPESYTLLPR